MKRINIQKDQRKKLVYAALSLILILTFFLGVYKITAESLWEDELYTYENANRSVAELIFGHADILHPPIYKLFMHFWMIIFGTSELSLRFPSVIFGVLAVGVMFFLGKELYNDITGLTAAGLLGISEFFVYYMQEARPYVLLALISLLSSYLFIKFLKEKSNNLGLLYGFCILIGLYTHYFMAVVILFQNIFFVINYKKYKVLIRKWLFIQVIVLILFSIWFLQFVFPEIISNYSSFGWSNPNLISVEYLFNVFTGNFKLSYMGLTFTVLILFLFLFNLFDTKLKKFMFAEEDLFLLTYLFIPLISVFIFSQFKSIWMPRYLIIVFPAFIFIIARTLLTFKWIILQIAFCLALIIGNAFGLNQMYMTSDKSDLRSAVSYIMDSYKKGDLIISYRFPTSHIEYYANKNISKDVTYLYSIAPNETPSELSNKISNRETVFIVYLDYRGNNKKNTNYLESKVKETNQSSILIEKKSFKDIRVEKYEKIYTIDKISDSIIEFPPKAFTMLKTQRLNDTFEFDWANDSINIKFTIPENNYSLNFEVLCTSPPPIKLDILLNNQSYKYINNSCEMWNKASINLNQISNETNILRFTFSEDAYSEWENGTIKYDRNGFIRNISLVLKIY